MLMSGNTILKTSKMSYMSKQKQSGPNCLDFKAKKLETATIMIVTGEKKFTIYHKQLVNIVYMYFDNVLLVGLLVFHIKND